MAEKKETAPEQTCPKCNVPYDDAAVKAALKTCPACGWHYRMEPEERIAR